MGEKGWCPFARHHRGWRKEGPFGYPAGERDQNQPVMLVDHIMAGHKSTLDNDEWRFDNWVGVHFGIGKDGSVDQYTNIFDAHWGNGIGRPIEKYDRRNKNLALLETLGTWRPVVFPTYTTYALTRRMENVLNTHSISFEHEGFPGDVWTPEMVRMSIAVKVWCIQELNRYGRKMALDDHLLVRHAQIDATDRASCPGPNYPRQRILDGVLAEADVMTPAEKKQLDDVTKALFHMRVQLNELANGTDAVVNHNDVQKGNPIHLRGLWQIAKKEWPFGK